jgi:predicted transcriptional regulator
MNTFDLLGDMPSEQRTIMRLFLRNIEMSLGELQKAIEALPEEKHMNQETIEQTLENLIQKNWVERIEENGEIVYSVVQKRES